MRMGMEDAVADVGLYTPCIPLDFTIVRNGFEELMS